MKKLLCILFLMLAASAFASGITPNGASRAPMATDGNNLPVQGGASDPLQTFLIEDNLSHTISVSANLWFAMNYNGGATCIVRLMDTSAKGSHAAVYVGNGTSYSRVLHRNALYLNYSGCNSGAYPYNSVLELQ